MVDTFLSMPAPRAEKAKRYDSIRKQTMDDESQSMEMPAEYMFKGVPHYEELSDPVAEVLAQMDEHGIRVMMPGIHENPDAKRACTEHPDRFAGIVAVDPNTGMESVRKLAELRPRGARGLRALSGAPASSPRCRSTTRRCTRSTPSAWSSTCRSCCTQAYPGPRILMSPQYVGLLDEVCWYFPELKIVVRHGAEPWTELMVKLLLKWPNLYYSTSAFAPKHYPEDIIHFANTRGADKIIYAGYYSAGLGLDRIFSELPNVPFRDHVWPKFLRENAIRVFGLEDRFTA